MMSQKLNKTQVYRLKILIREHIHELLSDKNKAAKTFEKIKKYGVATMQEAIALYKANRHVLEA